MKNRNLIIVDNDPKNLRILKNHFFEANFQVDEATSDAEAIEKCLHFAYDAVLCEVEAVNVDGFKILETLRKSPQSATAVFFLTQKSDVLNRVKSFRLGAKDYIVKPVHVKEIAARVNMILSRLDRRRERPLQETMFSGPLEKISIKNLINLFEQKEKSGTLRLQNRQNEPGCLLFHRGHVVQAACADKKALAAVRQILSWDRGGFSMQFSPIEASDEIGVRRSEDLFQGAQRMEERDELLQQLPSLETVLVTTDNFKKIVSKKNLTQDLNYFIALFDGERSLTQILHQSVYDEITSLGRILKLFNLGFLEAKRSAAPSPAQTLPEPVFEKTARPAPATPREEEMEENWPEEKEASTADQLHVEALDQLQVEPFAPEPEPADPLPQPSFDKELHHDYVQEGLSDLLTRDFSKWDTDSGYEKDLFYELRASAEEKSAQGAPSPLMTPADDSQLLFPTWDMVESEHPADALLTLEPDREFSDEEKPGPISPPLYSPVDKFDDTQRNAHPAVEPLPRPPQVQTDNRFRKAYGHILILGSEDPTRAQLVASLTSNQVFVKTYEDMNWSNVFYGTAEFKGGHLLNIISLSIEKEFTALVEFFSRSLFGYILLVDTADADWHYYRYLNTVLPHILRLPSLVIIPASVCLKHNMSELDWRKQLGLSDHQSLITHVEFDPITCKRFIFRLFEKYYRDKVMAKSTGSSIKA